MTNAFIAGITDTLSQIEAEGLYKRERLITSPQSGTVSVAGREVINLCANNYLGLTNNPDLITAAFTDNDLLGPAECLIRSG